MTSANPAVSALHSAFCDATGRALQMTYTGERYWLECHNEGLTPGDLRAVILHRKAAIKAGDRKPSCLAIRNICGSSEAILDVLDEAAMLRAKARKKTLPPGKASMLRQTGRSDAMPEMPPKAVWDVLVDAVEKHMNKQKDAAK